LITSNAQTGLLDGEALLKWDYPDSVWNKAALSSHQIDPFCCTTTWQASFYEAFEPDRNLFIRDSENSLIAFAEYRPPSAQVFLTPIDLMWQFCNPLLGPDAVELFVDALPEIEDIYLGDLPHILLSGLAPEDDLITKLVRRFGRRFQFYRHRQEVQCVASLKGGFDGYLSRRSTSHRRGLKKQMNRARSRGVAFERCSPVGNDTAETIFKRMVDVELASWKGIGKCGMAEEPQKTFYEILLKRMSRTGDARVIFAQHDGKDIGYIYGGIAGNIYRGQQFSFDEDWRKASIGNLLQYEQIKWLCEEGCERYDMGPIMDYKMHWIEQRLPLQSVMMVAF
jgi:hypothetical protein